jgi:ketosteroid isomerase-like protein
MNNDPILAAEESLRVAMLANDVGALDRLIDDDLLFTGIDGSLATKADDLAAHRARRLRVTRMEPLQRRVLHVAPGVAVVNVLMEFEGTWDGSPANARLRYTRVWRERGGAWRIVAGHLSALPDFDDESER